RYGSSPSMRVRRKSIGGTSATSAAVQTSTTPGAPRAALVSIETIRPCACADRTTRMCNWCAKPTSAANRPRPVTSGRSSSRGTERPMKPIAPTPISPLATILWGQRQRVEVTGFVDADDAERSTANVDFVDAARLLRDAPVGRQRHVKTLHQNGAVHAVMADQHNRVAGMPGQHEAQDVGGACSEVLQRFAVGKTDEFG